MSQSQALQELTPRKRRETGPEIASGQGRWGLGGDRKTHGRRGWLRKHLSERVSGLPGGSGPSARPPMQGYEGGGHGRQWVTAGQGKESSERQSESQDVVSARPRPLSK